MRREREREREEKEVDGEECDLALFAPPLGPRGEEEQKQDQMGAEKTSMRA